MIQSISLDLPESIRTSTITRRVIVSFLGRVFDILGLVNPVTMNQKIIFQQKWDRDLEWGDEVGALIANQFQHWMASLKLFSSLLEPRYLAKDSFQQVDLHLFCDASGLAYGVAIYARTTSGAGIHISRRCWRLSGGPLETPMF